MAFLNRDFLEKVFFALLLAGITMALIGGWQFLENNNQLSQNQAEQIHANGETVNPASTAEARGLVASDLERRRLIEARFNSMVLGGIGLVALSVGWLGTDIVRSGRRKQEETAQQPSATSPTA
ncbi:hypothetical protein G4Y79_10145 [Phototrophicus methaneseepsis]|uniref:Uncharacterized protein n=1 Tax=Phototrophicus methaneseepsis TaxID=2710758 RepID=A0A7S8EDG2_9CHLR|nr:hypothetical protein [Phototrophicus methaneseepsis]QPC84713.1 hypothetical protein G4Y79_10145 [Phototrophicus methaneseepsis]